MTVETEVAALTSAVNNLTASVNVAKGTLDAKVSDAQTAEANAASHEVTILGYKNAAETAAASAVSVVQQDLSALGFDVPHGAVAICPIDPYEHGFVTWPVHGKQSWRSEARATGKYLGVHGTTASAWAVTDAAAGDYYWDSTNQNVYELTGTPGASQVYRAGSANFTARWAVAFADKVALLDEAGAPWRVIRAGHDYLINTAGSGSISSAAFAAGRLIVGSTTRGITVLDWAQDTAIFGISASIRPVSLPIADAADQGALFPTYTGDELFQIAHTTVNAVAAAVLPDAPIKNGVPVPTIAVATDGGLSFIHDDGTVTSRPETEANMETTDVEFIGNSGAYRYQHGWSAGHDARVVYAPAEYLKDTSVLAYNTDLYQSWETPVIGFNKTTDHANALRQMDNRTDPNGTSRVIAGDSMGGDRGITRVRHNEANPPASMVAYQADEFTTPPMFGDVKGAFLCEQGQAGVLAGANYLDEDFSGYADTAALQAAWVPQNGSGVTLNAGTMEVTRVNETSVRFDLGQTIPAGSTVTISWDVTYNITSAYAYLGFDGSTERTPQNSNYAPVGSYTYTVTLTGDRSDLVVFLGGTASFTVGLDNIKIDVSHPDRSVNGNGLIMNGSLTQDADGWVDGFAAANYLAQPYNTDLDFGTDDFYISADINLPDDAASHAILGRTASGGNGGIQLYVDGNKYLQFRVTANDFGSAPRLQSAYTVPVGQNVSVTAVRRSGVLYTYINGVLQGNLSAANDVSNTLAETWLGRHDFASVASPFTGDLRRVVIGAGAPSAKQIEVMANWIGDRLEGAFKDMWFVKETGVLHVLTDAYHYEVDADGAVLKSTPNTETWLKVTASRDGVVRTS